MKNLASVKEKEKRNKNNIGHGESRKLRYSLWLIIFTSALSCLAIFYHSSNPVVFAAKEQPISLYSEVRRSVLDNGMVVLLKEKHSLPLVSIFLCVQVGSAREGKFTGSGISHFIEHMVFKGTAQRPVGQIFKEIESYGGEINAFTSYDYTGYNITIPTKFVPQALEILADMMSQAGFDEEELKKEREVVLREIKLSYDSPQRYAAKLLWQTAFIAHPYKHPILGKKELFKQLTRKDLLNFYQQKYQPANMVLAIVGNIQAEQTLKWVKVSFTRLPESLKSAEDIKIEPEQKRLRTEETKFTLGLTYLLLGFHSVALTDEDCFALDVLATILGQGKSSRLYKLICDKKSLVYSIESNNYTPSQPGLFMISSILEEPKRKKVISLILKQMDLLKKRPVSEQELESAKNKLTSEIIFYNQTLAQQARDIALNEVITGDFNFTEKYLHKINQVTKEDINRVVNKYLHKNNLSIVALTPLDSSGKSKQPANLDTSWQVGIENFTPQTGLSQEEITATSELINTPSESEVKKYLLDNGLTLLVSEKKDLPIVSMYAVFQGGLRAEQEETNGICNLVSKLIDKGTKSEDAEKIAFLLESKGARYSSFSGNNSFGFRLDLLSKDFDFMLKLFAEMITRANFPQREIQRQKKLNLATLKAQKDSIFTSGAKILKTTLFHKHPYKFDKLGNERSLKRIKRKDVLKFYREFFTNKNMILAIFGDIDTEQIITKVGNAFTALNRAESNQISTPEEPKIKKVRRLLQPFPKQQCLLMMGFSGTTVYNSDRYSLELICQILSQTSGRMFSQIREKAGLAYSLGAYQILGLDPGYLTIYVATSYENVSAVKEEILKQLTLIQEGSVSEEELAQAKRSVLSKQLISRQTNADCALASAIDELYGLGFDHYLAYTRLINQASGEDIIQCAKKYFNLNAYAEIIIGSLN